ncbi:hypothetical protein BV25DRAFT_1992187 [Artomyces pyxidatus]|uniref:Uncharacterized protein n=1 Tax=Artomyces pyxidatus TaxID=48021 RepID=A0ACB8SZ83_9AGAM|nr:hypothetical protein BV25DRAFT_1992187 [Artomyces pyxidatus]
MGNSASSGPHNNNDLPARTSTASLATPHTAHRSLRTRRKSLELPDLASLSLTPRINSPSASPHPHTRRPKASSPIPIPAQSAAANANAAHPYQSYPRQRPRQLPSTTQMPEIVVQQPPSTHVPLFPSVSRHRATPAPSFVHSQLPPIKEPQRRTFAAETLTSTIPLGLQQAVHPPSDEAVLVKISWHGGGTSVVLARAGDDKWKGRQPMDRDSSSRDTFSTHVSLLPGTHHVKFLVDDVWRLAPDLPTAVDDDGSLANYVHVAFPSSLPKLPPHQPSFWAPAPGEDIFTSSDADGGWTSEIPPALLAAAREEELFLADGAQGVAPHIPPAPVLPRHLDKLILNARPTPPLPPKERRPKSRGRLAMTSSEDGDSSSRIPVTTASGTDVAAQVPIPLVSRNGSTPAAVGQGTSLTALVDDASVLPVPSHVVLHHLSTSAIRNGVLAVGNTTRYRKKFITTIYYKPT